MNFFGLDTGQSVGIGIAGVVLAALGINNWTDIASMFKKKEEPAKPDIGGDCFDELQFAVESLTKVKGHADPVNKPHLTAALEALSKVTISAFITCEEHNDSQV
jgi:hypothetical protein